MELASQILDALGVFMALVATLGAAFTRGAERLEWLGWAAVMLLWVQA